LLLAYHDRSDGGAFAALCEMAFCRAPAAWTSAWTRWGENPFRTLFNEELGAVVQVASEDRADFADLVARHGLVQCAQRIARPTTRTPAGAGGRRGQRAGASGAGRSCSTPGGR
jgi:phosphoribosylformylglycinamidine synthase